VSVLYQLSALVAGSQLYKRAFLAALAASRLLDLYPLMVSCTRQPRCSQSVFYISDLNLIKTAVLHAVVETLGGSALTVGFTSALVCRYAF